MMMMMILHLMRERVGNSVCKCTTSCNNDKQTALDELEPEWQGWWRDYPALHVTTGIISFSSRLASRH
jgi:hypothetical protein